MPDFSTLFVAVAMQLDEVVYGTHLQRSMNGDSLDDFLLADATPFRVVGTDAHDLDVR